MTEERTTQTPSTGFSVNIKGNAVGNAFGPSASVTANTIAGGNVAHHITEVDLFQDILRQIDRRPSDVKVDKEEILEAFLAIVQATEKTESLDEKLVERRLRAIARMAPDILEAIIHTSADVQELRLKGSHRLEKIHQLLAVHFNEEELKHICFLLHVDYDDLPGDGKISKARELVLHFERRGKLDDLENQIIIQRPNISLPPKVGVYPADRSTDVAKTLNKIALQVQKELLG